GAEDRFDLEERDAVFAVDHQAQHVEALHHSRERLQRVPGRLRTAVRVRRKHPDHVRVQWQCGGIVAANGVDVGLDHLNCLISHCQCHGYPCDGNTPRVRSTCQKSSCSC